MRSPTSPDHNTLPDHLALFVEMTLSQHEGGEEKLAAAILPGAGRCSLLRESKLGTSIYQAHFESAKWEAAWSVNFLPGWNASRSFCQSRTRGSA